MRKRPAPLSVAARAKRQPPPPEALVGALHDRVHKDTGRLIICKRCPKCGALWLTSDQVRDIGGRLVRRQTDLV